MAPRIVADRLTTDDVDVNMTCQIIIIVLLIVKTGGIIVCVSLFGF